MEACSSVEDEFVKNLLSILLQFALFTAGKTLPKQKYSLPKNQPSGMKNDHYHFLLSF